MEDLAQGLATAVTARSALLNRPEVPEGGTSEHGCENLSQKRRNCRERVLSRSGTDARVTDARVTDARGTDARVTDARVTATVCSCRPCNRAVHSECFWKARPSTSSLTVDNDWMIKM